VIVLSFGAEPRDSETTLSWIGTTRRLLRPTDLAGRLSSVTSAYLPDTSREGAASCWRGFDRGVSGGSAL
jgi:hypothetical protein